MRASYNISLSIARSGKPHTIVEQLILSGIEEVLETVSHKPVYDKLNKIPLSDNSIQKRIGEMSHDDKRYLYNY